MTSPFETVPGFELPHPSNIIWRYMSLEKFLDMLETQTLRFTQAASMSDAHELRLPYEKLESIYFRKRKSKEKSGDGEIYDLFEDDWHLLESQKKRSTELRERSYLSSWTVAQTESYALWKIYLGGSRAGVAIKSTYAALQKSIRDRSSHIIKCVKVRYSDDVNPKHLNDEHFIFQQRLHYDYEKELRLAIDFIPEPERTFLDPTGTIPNQTSIEVNVDLNTIVREIYLSPFAMQGFRKSFESIVRKIKPGLKAIVSTSAVRDS